MLRDLSLLFAADGVPRDRTGSLAHVRELLGPLGPTLVFLARHTGQVIAVDPIGAEAHGDELVLLATRMASEVRTRSFTVFAHAGDRGPRTAFAVRLGPDTMGSLLGGLVLDEPGAAERLEVLLPSLEGSGNLAWIVQDERAAVERADARKNQLRTEHETLRNAHVQALATVLEEQQRRVEAERRYSQRLESEVEERSRALREAVEDARRRSEELQEYSLALENANRALEQFYQRAEAANRAKSQFLANVSHEIRTPMTAILGYAELLAEEGLAPEQHAEYLDTIRRNGEHLLEIINDILDIAKVEAGKLEIARESVSVRRLVEDVCALLRVRAEAKGIGLAAEIALEAGDRVETDPSCLRQILINLIGNAVKFTNCGGVRVLARIAAAESGRARLEIEVGDTGPGIPEEEIPRIFDPFTQTEATVRGQLGGTGLGLAICRRLTTALGGRIECQSTLGKGSTFRVALPVQRMQGDGVAESGPRAAGEPATVADPQPTVLPAVPCRVLVVEDSPDSQRLLETILRKAGAEVTVAANGHLALEAVYGADRFGGAEAAAPVRFDVILMDMQMPVLDGYAATEILRERGWDGPVVALTANAVAGEQQRCLDCGCTAFLSKPVDRARLLGTLAGLVAAR